MDLARVMIEERSGNLLVPGRISIRGAGDDPQEPGVPDHDMVSLQFEPWHGGKLRCRIVTSTERLETGFYSATTEGPVLSFRLITMSLLQQLLGSRASFQGEGVGDVEYGAAHDVLSLNTRTRQAIAAFDMSAAFESDGLRLGFSGVTGNVHPGTAGRHPSPMPAGTGFTVDAVIPWETLIVEGFGPALFRPKLFTEIDGTIGINSEQDTGERRNFLDLMINPHGMIYVYGRISIGGRDQAPSYPKGAGKDFVTDKVIDVSLTSEALTCMPVYHFERFKDGFCNASHSAPCFTFEHAGWDLLEHILAHRDCARLFRRGHGLGTVDLLIGYAAVDNGGAVRRPIEAVDIRAELDRDGLKLFLEGTLGEFDPTTLGDMRRSQLPGVGLRGQTSRFEVEALLPYALLVARNSRTSHRVRKMAE